MARYAHGMTRRGHGLQPAMIYSRTPRWRKLTARAVEVFGVLLGIATALTYEALVWTSPGPDWSHAQLRGTIGVYVTLPLLILGGTICLCCWIATRVDPDRPGR